MSLVFVAMGLEVYQVVAHAHCWSGRTLPLSHRTTRGFGAAIAVDALGYALSCACLAGSGRAWALLLIPLVAHLFYGCLLAFFRAFYMRIHDYRLGTIYSDATFCRAKQIASLFDTGFHVLAVVLLARHAPTAAALSLLMIGLASYWIVFGRAGAAAAIVQDKHA